MSTTTFWEVAIKASIEKLELHGTYQEFRHRVQHEFKCTHLPIDLDALALIATLPLHHRDPFDRLLIAQAISQNLPIVTRDPAFAGYPIEILW